MSRGRLSSSMKRSITIPDVPEGVRNELAARAAAAGQSLPEYLRARLIEMAGRPDREAIVRRIRQRKAHTDSGLSREQILEHRESDRR